MLAASPLPHARSNRALPREHGRLTAGAGAGAMCSVPRGCFGACQPWEKAFSTESFAVSAFCETAPRSGGRGDGKTQPSSPCSGRTRSTPAQLPHVCFLEGEADRQAVA